MSVGPAAASAAEITQGHLLDGRVRHAQFRHGHRTGIEPVLLAACVPARAGERVLEAGTGSGAGLLCLAARVPGLRGIGVERDTALADLARANLRDNGFDDLSIVTADIAAFRDDAPFDHAFANPPWHAEDGTPSPDRARDAARRADDQLFRRWVGGLAGSLRSRGTLSLVIAVAALPACLAACEGARCGSTAIFPLWPRPGEAAKLVLLRAVRDGRAACRLLAGLTLHTAGHTPGSGFTAEADAVLRGGVALTL